MALIEWKDSLSVQVGEIDGQHQKLIGMINDLNEAMKQGKGKTVVGEVIDGLINYTDTHFKTEERYFDRFGYPQTEAHKKEHANFVEKVLDFRTGMESGKLGLSIEVMNFLSSWLTHHITVVDKQYTQFFNDHGLH